ncbi:uncharacterized protein LOC131605869 [Vicia villosa]|uniref:uncharacterized protein LOC131605869 n=1 Tax=Vicia villosa TaxID=3911 RepID=UPI00273BDEE2|nr:uncharacterized protein LOC131605869 [Vicia villosa]
MDNAMVATEIIHALKRKTSGSIAHLALKIDISKAYDRVDWGFLRGILLCMGFHEKWIHWIMMCVTSVHYSVLVNSDRVGPIIPGRGLRQGDPLSPYLFILVSEGLSALIRGAVSRGDLHGAQICRGAPSVANLVEVTNLMGILNIYAEATGQEINLSKSEVYFSRNISRPAQEDLAKLMGVRHVLGTGTYLGLPSMIGRSKKATFSFLKDRIWKKINSWSGRSLSRAGKEVMIKSVLQSILTYIMSLYLIPDGVVKDVEKMLNSFCLKSEGGMGFRDFKAFNLAMIAKQGWNFLSKPNSLVARIFKARYFPRSTFLDSKIGNNPSYVWRSLWKAKDVLKLGSRWSIRDGSNIKVMHDPWLREKDGWWINGPQKQGVYDLFVKDLMRPDIKQWDVGKVLQVFGRKDADSILKIPLVEEVVVDRLTWQEEQSGEYCVKSGYRLWRRMQNNIRPYGTEGNWNHLWSILAPPRAKHLLWRICRDCLPTRSKLQQFHVQCPVLCPWCELEDEDDWHVFFGCPSTSQSWWAAARDNRSSPVDTSSSEVWVPPMVNRIKCNVDAAFNTTCGTSNRGWCFRDHMGSFITGGVAWDVGALSVIKAEATALKEAIQNAISLHFSHVTFESDCQIVTKAIHAKHVGNSEFSLIVKNIQNLLLLFPNFEVKFIKRQANLVAHTLAKAANSWSRRSFFNMIPLCIEHCLSNESR